MKPSQFGTAAFLPIPIAVKFRQCGKSVLTMCDAIWASLVVLLRLRDCMQKPQESSLS